MGLLDWIRVKNSTEEAIHSNEAVCDFSNFDIVTKYLYEKSGIIELDKKELALSRLKSFAQDNSVYTTHGFLNTLKESREFYQEVLNIVTVNETYFFREMLELEKMMEWIKKLNREVDILSLPCSSGEEVYTVLIMANEAGVNLNEVNITGYDLNSKAVEYAKEGKYNERSLHKPNESQKQKYFTHENGFYYVSNLLKSYASFYQHNIFDLGNVDKKYDIVLSRNMFIYFDEEKKNDALNIISKLLKKDGIYIKGHADHINEHQNLEKMSFGIYKKV